ncbi:hypothetical protein MUB16_17300 [Priestia sp. OVL9]|nr:hypothetical protein [Priestia sp. OVL9]
MSIKENYQFTFINETDNILQFELEENNIYAKIMILETDIIRILFTDGEELQLDKTWSVAPEVRCSIGGAQTFGYKRFFTTKL